MRHTHAAVDWPWYTATMFQPQKPPQGTPKTPQKPLPPLPPIGRWRPTTPRQRLGIIGVALATAAVLWALLLFRPGAKVREFPPDPPLPACAPGQTSGCIGGPANVTLLPARPASAAAAPPLPLPPQPEASSVKLNPAR